MMEPETGEVEHMPSAGRRFLIPAVCAGLGALGWLLPTGLEAEVVDRGALLPAADRSFQQAQAASPYRIRVPSVLPAGMTLDHVAWSGPVTLVGRAKPVFSVDLSYAASDDRALHVWETSASRADLGAKDPLSAVRPDGYRRSPVVIGSRPWMASESPGAGIPILSAVLDEDIVVSVDARGLTSQELESAASSMG